MIIQENIPLAPFTTLQIGGPARYFVQARSEAQIAEALHFAAEHSLETFVLGGGSNLVVSDEGFPGLVLQIGLHGIETEDRGTEVLFRARAGENWDDLVGLTVSRTCAGVECMSGIPGTVGGTPVQNVGAYGQEVSQTIEFVRVLDVIAGEVRNLSNADCRFAYRTSIFNTDQQGRYIVLEVGYKLKAGGNPTIEYADLKNFFATSGRNPSLQDVRQAVRRIRQSKAMLIMPGDEDCRSAGSFFKNPIVPQEEAERVRSLARQRFPDEPIAEYRADNGKVKLSAAWLVEHSGFQKGFSRGPVGISRKHALAIVNRGGGTARDIIGLKDEIQDKVQEWWGVRLQPEPVFLGFAGQPSTLLVRCQS